ncbi:MAG: helix-turn-helix domain-containing protein [Bdellovibrionales bacterium]
MSTPEVGKFLREKRILAGLTQKQVSDHLGYSSSQFVSNWERGQCLPPPQKLKKLIKLLDISGEQLANMIFDEKKRALHRVIFQKL